jgi:ubiquinone/menaquinone biosynthesis C-methylase UbiE
MHAFTHHQKGTENVPASEQKTRGIVMNWGWRYDLLVGLITLGREGTYRRGIAEMAHLQPGEAVLDVGCGTGTLALVAKGRVGATGRVCGIDPGPEQIARARRKAARRKLAVDFHVGVIERLAFADHSFDVVLSTLMMHHLPEDLKRLGLAEIARVLKPGGRLLVVDISGHMGSSMLYQQSHGGTQNLPALLQEAGFTQIETGKANLPRISFVSGRISRMEEERS